MKGFYINSYCGKLQVFTGLSGLCEAEFYYRNVPKTEASIHKRVAL